MRAIFWNNQAFSLSVCLFVCDLEAHHASSILRDAAVATQGIIALRDDAHLPLRLYGGVCGLCKEVCHCQSFSRTDCCFKKKCCVHHGPVFGEREQRKERKRGFAAIDWLESQSSRRRLLLLARVFQRQHRQRRVSRTSAGNSWTEG